jgi:hypothetical protein
LLHINTPSQSLQCHPSPSLPPHVAPFTIRSPSHLYHHHYRSQFHSLVLTVTTIVHFAYPSQSSWTHYPMAHASSTGMSMARYYMVRSNPLAGWQMGRRSLTSKSMEEA